MNNKIKTIENKIEQLQKELDTARKEIEIQIGDIVVIEKKPNIWINTAGGHYPLGGAIDFPFVGEVINMRDYGEDKAFNIGGYGFCTPEAVVRKATNQEIFDYSPDGTAFVLWDDDVEPLYFGQKDGNTLFTWDRIWNVDAFDHIAPIKLPKALDKRIK